MESNPHCLTPFREVWANRLPYVQCLAAKAAKLV